MGRTRLHEDNASKQRAYRERRRAEPPLEPVKTHSPYVTWKKRVFIACKLLRDTCDQAEQWMTERSDEWLETDMAERLVDDIATFRDALGELEESHLMTRDRA